MNSEKGGKRKEFMEARGLFANSSRTHITLEVVIVSY
jgi:hypothetical protein